MNDHISRKAEVEGELDAMSAMLDQKAMRAMKFDEQLRPLVEEVSKALGSGWEFNTEYNKWLCWYGPDKKAKVDGKTIMESIAFRVSMEDALEGATVSLNSRDELSNGLTMGVIVNDMRDYMNTPGAEDILRGSPLTYSPRSPSWATMKIGGPRKASTEDARAFARAVVDKVNQNDVLFGKAVEVIQELADNYNEAAWEPDAAWEREHAKTADEVYEAVTKGSKGERWVALAMMGSSDDEKRKLARMFTETIDRCRDAMDSGNNDPAVNKLYMECLLALPHIRIGGVAAAETVSGDDGLPIGTRIKDADTFGTEKAELFSRENEKYLASLGL